MSVHSGYFSSIFSANLMLDHGQYATPTAPTFDLS